MSEEQAKVEGELQGQEFQLSDDQEAQPTTEAQASLDMRTFEEKLEELRNEMREYADRTAQSASDKRFAKVQSEIKKFKEQAESLGLQVGEKELSTLQARLLLEQQNQPEGDGGGEPPRSPQPAQPEQKRNPDIDWAIQTLSAAGVPNDAPEYIELRQQRFGTREEFQRAVLGVANQFASKQTQQAPQQSPPVSPAIGMGGQPAANRIGQLQYKLNNLKPTHPEYNKTLNELKAALKQRQ